MSEEQNYADALDEIKRLNARITELVDIGDNLFDSLNPIAWKHEWLDNWWKLSSCIRRERDNMLVKSWQKRPIEDELNARIAELEAAGAKLADATQDLINALPLEFSNWEIVPVHKALLDWNDISKESEE